MQNLPGLAMNCPLRARKIVWIGRCCPRDPVPPGQYMYVGEGIGWVAPNT